MNNTVPGSGLKSKLTGAPTRPISNTISQPEDQPLSSSSSSNTHDFLAQFWADAHDSILWADRQYVKDLLHPQLWSRMEFEFNAAEQAMSYSHTQHQMLLLLDGALQDEQITDKIQETRMHIVAELGNNQLARARFADAISCILRSACSRRSTYSISSDLVDDIGRQVRKYCEVGVALNLWVYTHGELLAPGSAAFWRAQIECLQLSEMASDRLRRIILRLDLDGVDGLQILRQQLYDIAQSILENLEAMQACRATETAEGKQWYRRVREDMVNYEALMDIMKG